ncbi:MAG TPA: HAD family hydrolase [Candidatus Wolfebacteria bacterium]|nr:HAD family hydrolase [Candidatus Wolfebacteria bacterium]
MIENKDVLKTPFWSLPNEEVLEILETSENGLSDEELKRRLKIFGSNILESQKRIPRLRIFLRQFQSPLIFILLIAGVITLFLERAGDSIIIFAAVVVNSVLGFYQENKAEEALANLKTYIEERAKVIRDKKESEINAKELVPGDIIHLSQGDRVPADSRIISANDLMVDESVLTGESLPDTKSIEQVDLSTVLADRKSMVFGGTLINQGVGMAVVCATGKDTELGKIAVLVSVTKQERTPLQSAIKKFSWEASLVLVVLTLAIFVIGLMVDYSFLEMFFISVAIMVSAIPEGLPIALTVILATGVQRLAKKHGIVRKLLAAETMGSTTVILTDKTGTLTQAKMDLSKIITADELINDERKEDEGETKEEQSALNRSQKFILELAVLNSEVIIENPEDLPENWRVNGRHLETSLVKKAGQIGISFPKLQQKTKLFSFLPFNAVNKFSAGLLEYSFKKDVSKQKLVGKYFLNFFGAPETLLDFSSKFPNGKKITKEQYQEILTAINQAAASGERVLGVATKSVKNIEEFKSLAVSKGEKEQQVFKDLCFWGLITFRDPIRPNIKKVIEEIKQVGVKTVIVTGDHQGTAEAVAKEIGFEIDSGSVINGFDLDILSDEELKRRLPMLKVFSRITPEGKVRIVKAYQECGEIVAMTGDGVNDAPSLRQADIGVAVGSGTDVAKGVADLVILDNNFETIVAAVEEGRKISHNIKKVIVYLFSNVLDELFLIGGALLMGLVLPLNALQILWVNFFSDSFPAVALAFENQKTSEIQQVSHLRKGLFDKRMKFLIFIIGTLTSFLLFALYAWLLKSGFEGDLVRTFIFAAFGFYTLFLIFSVRNLEESIFRYNIFSNKYLLVGVSIGLFLMFSAIYFAPLQNLLSTVSLPFVWVLGVLGFGLFNIFAIEFGKWLFRIRKKQLI